MPQVGVTLHGDNVPRLGVGRGVFHSCVGAPALCCARAHPLQATHTPLAHSLRFCCGVSFPGVFLPAGLQPQGCLFSWVVGAVTPLS